MTMNTTAYSFARHAASRRQQQSREKVDGAIAESIRVELRPSEGERIQEQGRERQKPEKLAQIPRPISVFP